MARWFRRPGPLVADSLLAVVLALVSLALANTGRAVEQGVQPGYDWTLTNAPRDPQAGDVWDARIVVFQNGKPTPAPGTVEPLLTVQNGSTGAWSTRVAEPTDVPGVYGARVVFRDAGPYPYSVLLSDSKVAPLPGERTGLGVPGGLVLLTLLAALPIALRRRQPVAVLGITLAGALAADLAYDSFPFLGPVVALYTVGFHVGRPVSLLAAGGTAAALPLLFAGDHSLGFWEAVAIYAVFGAAWLLGDNLRSRRERQRANLRRTAAEEQARIGRELHDIIGHSVSVMTIQAAAAGDAFDSRPAQVREALRAIETTGRETLSELRRLLAGDAAGFAPIPGLERLDALVQRVRAAGLDVELTSAGALDAIPPSVDLSAYRIVQEALTNTLKHAHASTARVDVRATNGTLEIAVVDDGRGAGESAPGHGIIGMRERAVLFGGSLTAGPAPGGGFAVRAHIPLEEPAP
jgi:signal transduction histidine kinase